MPRNAAKRGIHPMDLDGKVAVVAGGNRGIGLGIVRGLADAGCDVAVWARDKEKNREAEAQCADLRGQVAAFYCDVIDTKTIELALTETVTRFGRVDGVFINAGIGGGSRKPFLEQTNEEWQRVFNVNVIGAKNVLTPIIQLMIRQIEMGKSSGGRVVLTSSIAAKLGAAFNEHYAASKASLVAIARAIAVEFGRYGITANALMLGYVETEMIEDLIDNPKFLERVKMRLPSRRLATPDEFAGIAIYLMSEQSKYHAGAAITIDGAYSIS